MTTRTRTQGGPRSPAKGKSLIRSLNRAATRASKTKPVEASGRVPEPSACESCGAIFSKRVWRQGRRVTLAFLERINWTTCPACEQVRRATGLGRLLLRGDLAKDEEASIRRRIANVVARATHTQPERRMISIERRGDVTEVLTTSQKLAHRIAREIQKAFGGRVTYAWSDDGSLFATWRH